MDSLDLVDIRLLRLFEAIHALGSVTRAADRLGLSQPTVSIGLGKLRERFRDPLFVRTADGMQATPLADALVGPVREALQSLRRIAQWQTGFDPATAARRFRIAMSDASHITLLPQLLAHVRRTAPSIQLDAARIGGDTPAALQSGEADLAMGLIPGLGSGFYQQTLFRQDWVCVANARHPRIGKALTLEDYRGESHIGITSGTGQQLLDAALEQAGIARRIILFLPGILGLVGILAASDLIATLPRQIGTTLATFADLAIHACPFPVPGFPVNQHWHARCHSDPANTWLRSVCAELFNPATIACP